MLEPPNPGPYAGVPLGGIGSGCIGRGVINILSLEFRDYRALFNQATEGKLGAGQYIPGDTFIAKLLQTNSVCV